MMHGSRLLDQVKMSLLLFLVTVISAANTNKEETDTEQQ